MVLSLLRKRLRTKRKGNRPLKNIFSSVITNTVLNKEVKDVQYSISSHDTVVWEHQKTFTNTERVISEIPVIWLETSMGIRIPAAFLEKPGAKQTILYSHGNAEDMGGSLRYGAYLQEKLDVNVMVYEYSNFGHAEKPRMKNRVRCTEQHIYADINAAYNWLLEYGIEPGNIILFGRSMGSGPSVELAITEEIGGLVLISAIASVLRVASPWLPITIGWLDMFTNIDKMKKVECPVLSVHGQLDETSPFRHGQALFEAADVQCYMPFWPETAGHVDAEAADWNQVCQYYDEFLTCISAKSLTPRSSESAQVRYTFDNMTIKL